MDALMLQSSSSSPKSSSPPSSPSFRSVFEILCCLRISLNDDAQGISSLSYEASCSRFHSLFSTSAPERDHIELDCVCRSGGAEGVEVVEDVEREKARDPKILSTRDWKSSSAIANRFGGRKEKKRITKADTCNKSLLCDWFQKRLIKDRLSLFLFFLIYLNAFFCLKTHLRNCINDALRASIRYPLKVFNKYNISIVLFCD